MDTPQESTPTVGISLFCLSTPMTRTRQDVDYYPQAAWFLYQEAQKITHICRQITQAALKQGATMHRSDTSATDLKSTAPSAAMDESVSDVITSADDLVPSTLILPQFFISVLFVPYDPSKIPLSKTDMDAQNEKIRVFQDTLNQLSAGQYHIVVQQLKLTSTMLTYINHCESPGNILDLMKIQSIIQHQDVDFLQLDSSTFIHDPNRFYQLTFGQDSSNPKKKFVLNRYMASQWSVNNKICYVPKTPKRRAALATEWQEKKPKTISFGKILENELTPHINSAIRPRSKTKTIQTIEKLPLYNYVFLRALEKTRIIDEEDQPTSQSMPHFDITATILIAPKQTWSKEQAEYPHWFKVLKSIPPLTFTNAEGTWTVDYDYIDNLAKKHLTLNELPSSSPGNTQCILCKTPFEMNVLHAALTHALEHPTIWDPLSTEERRLLFNALGAQQFLHDQAMKNKIRAALSKTPSTPPEVPKASSGKSLKPAASETPQIIPSTSEVLQTSAAIDVETTIAAPSTTNLWKKRLQESEKFKTVSTPTQDPSRKLT